MAGRRGSLKQPASDGVVNGAIYTSKYLDHQWGHLQAEPSQGASYGANYSGLLVGPAQHIFQLDIPSDEVQEMLGSKSAGEMLDAGAGVGSNIEMCLAAAPYCSG